MGQRPLVMWSAVCSAPQSQLSEAVLSDMNGETGLLLTSSRAILWKRKLQIITFAVNRSSDKSSLTTDTDLVLCTRLGVVVSEVSLFPHSHPPPRKPSLLPSPSLSSPRSPSHNSPQSGGCLAQKITSSGWCYIQITLNGFFTDPTLNSQRTRKL